MIRSESIPNKVWKFVHFKEEWVLTNITGRKINLNRLVVEESGKIILRCSPKKRYAWDGCTPKWNFLHFTCGTPDGRLHYATEKPMTYYASMFHDALYQFKKDGCISRKEADLLFLLLMRRNKFMWSPVYYMAVRMFGGFCGKWKRKTSKYGVKIISCSWDHLNTTYNDQNSNKNSTNQSKIKIMPKDEKNRDDLWVACQHITSRECKCFPLDADDHDYPQRACHNPYVFKEGPFYSKAECEAYILTQKDCR